MINKKEIIFLIMLTLISFGILCLLPFTISKRELFIYLITIFLTALNIIIVKNNKSNKKYLFIPKYILIFFTTLLILLGLLKLHYTIAIFTSTILPYIILLYKTKKRNYISIIIHLIINFILIHMMLLKVSSNPLIVSLFMTIISYFYLLSLYLYKHHLKDIKSIYDFINNSWQNIINKKSILTKFIPHNIITFMLLLISIFTVVKFALNTNDNYYVYVNNMIKDNIGPILEKTKIDLDFIDTNDTIDTLCLKFATYNRINDSNMTFQIENANGIIYTETFNTKYLIDNGDKCFNINTTSIAELKTYDIYLIPDESTTKDNAVTLYNSKDKNIILSLGKLQKSNVNPYKWIIIAYAIIAFLIVNYVINTKKLTPEKYFLWCLLYIIPIALIMPPLQVPDEHFHFYKSYNLSFINVHEAPNKVINSEKILVPEDISCIDYAGLGVANRLYTDENLLSCVKNTENIRLDNEFAGYKSFFGYFPQSIGIKLADLFTNSSLTIFFMGRLFALLFSASIIYLAIKITPKYKHLFLITSTMMMFIQEMTSYSYDSVLNAICFLFIAFILKLIYDSKKLNIWHYLLIISLLVIIIDIKSIYLSLGLMLFLIPKTKFDNKLWKKLLAIFISIGISIILSGLLKYYFTYHDVLVTSENDISRMQISYLLSHPLSIIRIAINTFDLQAIFYLKSITGYFAYFTFGVNNIYIIVYFLLFIYVILSEENKDKILNRLVLITSFLIAAAGIFAAMYLYSSEYQSGYVAGVQGRYFYPVLIPLLIALIPKKSRYKLNDSIIYSVISILLLQMIMVFGIWYY